MTRSTGDERAPARPEPYREYAPPPHLRDHVECFWRRAAGPARADGLVLPDGCIDVIWIGERSPVVVGAATRATAPDIAAGVEIVGVRFRPGVAPHLLGVSARDVRDRTVPLRAIWPHDRAAGWLDVMARPALEDRLGAVADLIAMRLPPAVQVDPLVRQIVTWTAADPRLGLDEIASRCGVSERHVRRRVEQAIGYGPKTLQRVLRLQRLLWLASGPDSANRGLARLASAAGYADQPHMTRETIALAGATPRQLLQGERVDSAVSELFKTAAREDVTLTLPG